MTTARYHAKCTEAAIAANVSGICTSCWDQGTTHAGTLDGLAIRAEIAAQPISYVWDETVRTKWEKVGRPGEFYETGTWVPVPGVVFTARASAGWLEVSATVPTPELGKAIAAQFPKSAGVKGGAVSGHWSADDWAARGWVDLRARLAADGTNKGVNETGLRRYRSFARHAERLGYEVRYEAKYGNSLTEAEFTALTG